MPRRANKSVPAKSSRQHHQISPFLAGNAAWLRSSVRPGPRYPEPSEAEIAKRAVCTPSNVHQVLSVFLRGHSEQELRDFQANKADIYDAVQMRALASVTQDKLRKSSAGSLVTVAAILEDKALLIRGRATSINGTALIDVLDAIRSREKVSAEALTR